MFIKLTNAAEQHKSKALYINPDHITTVYELVKEGETNPTTFIYGGPTGVNWEVEESLDDVIKLLNKTGTKAVKA